jgi:hypothetical protein
MLPQARSRHGYQSISSAWKILGRDTLGPDIRAMQVLIVIKKSGWKKDAAMTQ